MRLWSVEGNRQRLDGGAMFGNVPRNLWAQWLVPDDENRLEFACRCLLVAGSRRPHGAVRDGHRRVLQSEAAARATASSRASTCLLRSLAARGVAHEDVDVVVLSHLHFDHAGGLLTAFDESRAPELLFPRARYIVSKRAWERARAPHPRDRASYIPELPELLSRSGRLEIVDRPHSTVLGAARALRLQRRPYARARARRDRRRGRRRVLRGSDPGAPVGPLARHDGLRPLPRASDRREAPLPRGQDRARACVCSSRTTRSAPSRRRCAATTNDSA